MVIPTIPLLQQLIREDLQLSWSHLEDGRDDMALHHLASAAEKIEQIKNLKRAYALSDGPCQSHLTHSTGQIIDLPPEPHDTTEGT